MIMHLQHEMGFPVWEQCSIYWGFLPYREPVMPFARESFRITLAKTHRFAGCSGKALPPTLALMLHLPQFGYIIVLNALLAFLRQLAGPSREGGSAWPPLRQAWYGFENGAIGMQGYPETGSVGAARSCVLFGGLFPDLKFWIN